MPIRPMLALTALLLLAPAALRAEAPHRTVWDLMRFTWVRLERREPGTPPNAHPAAIHPGALRGLLEGVDLVTPEGVERLFTADELAHVCGPLAEALSLASKDEDAVLFSTFRHSGGIFTGGLTVTARLFVQAGKLQVIVRETRLDYAAPAMAETDPPRPGYGSRAEQGPAVLRVRQGELVRPDWLAFPIALLAAPAPAPQPAARPAAPAPASATERLLMLKQLREKDLITEEEYQKKRADILKDL